MEPTASLASPAAPSIDVAVVVAEELSLPLRGVAAVVKLLDEGATVPFIARYRKEVTGGLDEVQIRDIQEKRAYFRELEERRQDRKSTRLNSSHLGISYAVFCL